MAGSHSTAFAYLNPPRRSRCMRKPIGGMSAAYPSDFMDVVSGAHSVRVDGQSIMEHVDLG